MMVEGLDLEKYDDSAGVIIYGKLFPKLMKDFLTREDSKQMMESANLLVTTKVSTTVNTAITATVGPVPVTGTGTGAGNGTGDGQVQAIYKGENAGPKSQLLAQQRKLEKEAGKATTEGTVTAVETVAGV